MKHKVWDKLGQWDSNTFSKIDAQFESGFGVIASGYH
jgi:hypothetical protein